MFALGVRYLCGWAMATHPSLRNHAEWPPHPDRVFMALAAAHFETDGDPAERKALEWLEGLPYPSIYASASFERSPVVAFVPVNDTSSPIGKDKKPFIQSGSLNIGRGRQPRTFPVTIPDEDTVCIIWPHAEPAPAHRDALDGLCAKVTYIGHSASLVQMWVEDTPPEPNLSPSPKEHQQKLRVTGPGRLANLESRYRAGLTQEGAPGGSGMILRPTAPLWSGYRHASPKLDQEAEAPGSIFSREMIILTRAEGRPLGLESTLILTGARRGAVMKSGPQPPPEWVSGHGPDNRKSERDHLAFLPLADVGHQHADGHLMGVALALPKSIDLDEVAKQLSVIFTGEDESPTGMQLTMGSLGVWTVEPEQRFSVPKTLNPRTWVAPARRWATVTPIVLDKHPKAKGDEELIIMAACERIGLPKPLEVIPIPVSPHLGVPLARSFPPLPQKHGKPRYLQTHALILFDREVAGPILLGAGRYRGYGLCRPLRGEEGDGE